MVYGTGPDSVGLVERIATPIAAAGGNIVNLRQDVLHGLFTIFVVVDLAPARLSAEELTTLVRQISAETGLHLLVDQYAPSRRGPDRRDMLLVLVGLDRPGIVATISESLRQRGVNIEFSQAIAREDVFLMELRVDVRSATLPLENLLTDLRQSMGSLGIHLLSQTTDVFNRRKRILLFDHPSSLFSPDTLLEILRQTGCPPEELARRFPASQPENAARTALAGLDRLPLTVLEKVADALEPTPGTAELIQTLKMMGYKTALLARAFDLFTDRLAHKLALDHSFGSSLPIDDDTRSVDATLAGPPSPLLRPEIVIAQLIDRERVSPEVVTVLHEEQRPGQPAPGIRLQMDLRPLLELHNQRVLSRDNLLGLLGALGQPRL